MSVAQGIEAIRQRLAKPGEAVRLIGLSGTGKTRLVQALFESDAGGQSLDKAIVVYTDQGQSPNPSARDMMLKLGTNGRRAIAIVDNCAPETHQALTQIVATYSSFLSLITVEYDVRDDELEETHVFELTGSSPAVLEGILTRLAPHVSQNDRQRIVEFSDGNARVALALVRTLKKGQTLGFLNDNDLFKRLFMQNQGPNEALLRAAEACSLVYSFEGVAIDGADAELPILAALAGISENEIFRQITELKRRKLVQTRSKWRAVLPHALANRLAKRALANLPRSEVMLAFQGHERLLKSFTRRMSYLHDSPEACAIAQQWMEEWLANPATLNDLELILFLNLAPLVPEQALTNLERAVNSEQGAAFTSSDYSSRHSWMALARSLAYEPKLFDQAARICLAYAESDRLSERTGKDAWKALFHLHLSGTMAPPQQRIALLQEILLSSTPGQQELALVAFSEMLQCSYFSSNHDFGFGAHPRHFGWEPGSADDLRTWYCGVFELTTELASPGSPHRDTVRAFVARQLRQLWAKLGMHQEVSALVKVLAGTEGWPAGWAAIRNALRHDGKAMSPEHFEMLNGLERLLQPTTLKHRVDAYIFTSVFADLDEEGFSGTETSSVNIFDRIAEKVGTLVKEVVCDERLLQQLLPKLLSYGAGEKYAFGKGLAMASPNITARWKQLCAVLSLIEPAKHDIQLLIGFMEGARQVDTTTTEELLDSVVSNPLLKEYLPALQGSQCNDAAGMRLLALLNDPDSGFDLASLRLRNRGMSPDLYQAILHRLAGMPGGFQVAIESIHIEFFRCTQQRTFPNAELIALGRELLGMFNFEIDGENFEHQLNEVAHVCMQGVDATDTAIPLCQRFAEALHHYRIGAYSFGMLAETLFRHQPVAALDAFFSPPQKPLGRLSASGKSVVSSADSGALLAWVKAEPAVRAPLLAAEIEMHCKDADGMFSWSPIAASLLEIAPNKQEVLDGFSEHFRPRIWSGSIAGVLRPYQEFATRLAKDTDATVSMWAREQLALMNKRVAQESLIERRTDERFE